jgi:hypothetical protein
MQLSPSMAVLQAWARDLRRIKIGYLFGVVKFVVANYSMSNTPI